MSELKRHFTILLLMGTVHLVYAQSKQSLIGHTSNFKILSKGFNVGYRAGLSSKQHELLAGYYFSIIDRKRHRLLTFDHDLTSDFRRVGFNSSISYSNGYLALNYMTDMIKSQGMVRVIPGIGINLEAASLISLGVFYHYKSRQDIPMPALTFRLMIRPSFINVLFKNPDGSDW